MTTSSPAVDFRLLAISGGTARGEKDLDAFRRWVGELAADGVGAVQLREKALDDATLLRFAETVRRTAGDALRVLVNGRADVAVAAGADGVHLPSEGVPADAVRRRFPGLLVGVSTHRVDEVADAHRRGAHYVTFGPIHRTPSKPGWTSPPGLDALRRICRDAELPVFALGGVASDDLSDLAAAGAHGAAGIRAFHDPTGREEIVRRADAAWTSPATAGSAS